MLRGGPQGKIREKAMIHDKQHSRERINTKKNFARVSSRRAVTTKVMAWTAHINSIYDHPLKKKSTGVELVLSLIDKLSSLVIWEVEGSNPR